ncbi:ATPase/histidine kinase/DNA gyrase B/HSP90 domain protein, partial [Ostertagia ostertagi]
MLHADKTHLTNVVHNLIDNAIKYNDKPRLMLELIIQETDQEIYLMVKDNGMGISAADQQKVFDKFYRVPHGNLHDVKGYGLGLSYVKEIVRLHEGQIRIESVPGQG